MPLPAQLNSLSARFAHPLGQGTRDGPASSDAESKACDPRPHKLGLALAAAVFALDQALKWLMIGPLALREVYQIELLPIFNLTWTENHGVSLGLLTAGSETQRWMLVALTAAIAAGRAGLDAARNEGLARYSRSAWCWAGRSAISSTGRGSATSSTMPICISARSARS